MRHNLDEFLKKKRGGIEILTFNILNNYKGLRIIFLLVTLLCLITAVKSKHFFFNDFGGITDELGAEGINKSFLFHLLHFLRDTQVIAK